MRVAGFIVFVLGVVVASCYAARAVEVPAPPAAAKGADPDPEKKPGERKPTGRQRLSAWWNAAGLPFAGGMVLIVAGGLIARRRPMREPTGDRTERAGAELVTTDKGRTEDAAAAETTRSPGAILERIAGELDEIPVDDVAANADRVHERLDDVLENDVPEFLGQRQELIDALGLAAFAELMSHFAMMERNAGRAWSALIDEGYSVVPGCIASARDGLAAARKVLDASG